MLTESPGLRRAGAALLALLSLMLPPAAHAAPPDDEISANQAIAAWTAFAADPINELRQAPTFLRFIETHGGDVHVVINGNLLGFMQRDVPPAARAVLYAAFMGGNMRAQLESGDVADDPVAGMAAAVNAYQFLKAGDGALAVREMDYLDPHRGQASFAEAVQTLAAGEAFSAGPAPD